MNEASVPGYPPDERLHTGCCGVLTSLATAPSGRRVVLRHYTTPSLRRPSEPGWAERMRQAAPVGTVPVLDGDAGYLVTEYVPGGSLADRVAADGPLTGTELHRLAIPTMTALAAVRRAGLPPARIRPSRVLSADHGPVLLCVPPETHDRPPGETTPARHILRWEAPEQTRGEPAGHPAEVYRWALTMMFAATGHDGFRPGGGPADPPATAGALRDLLAACLADRPDVRPTAEQALLRLIEHTGLTGSPRRTRPVTGRTFRVAAAGVAIALVAAGGSAAVTVAVTAAAASRDAPAATPAPGPSLAAGWTPRAVPPVTASPGPAAERPLPGGLGVAYERPSDPVRLASIQVGTSRRYVRDPRTGGFVDAGPHSMMAEPSPDGRWLATFNTLYGATENHLAVFFTDHLTGERFSVPVLRPPFQSMSLAWSRQSDRVLLSAHRYERINGATRPLTVGYVLIDVARRTARFVPTDDGEQIKQAAEAAGGRVDPIRFYANYRWTPDGRSVAARFLTAEWGSGMRLLDPDTGRTTRILHWVGLLQGNADWFSPAGDRFVTSGCADALVTCVWQAETGKRVATVPGRREAAVIGWYDDAHLIGLVSAAKDRRRVVLLNLSGKTVRVLAEVRAPADAVVDLRYARG
ncbi:hypothetical protein [Nonomuraea sp. MG754425]|uniref:hypothetical protein n=1 Tax=Nonomuraea sp. MG754425 TaxID=2570319 RepID=UPI001F39D03F|nr:hypothetical protein [Nonomuraea sp. MG754425]